MPLHPLFAPIEPERALVQLAVATIEPLVEPFRARAVVPFHATIAPLDLTVAVLDVPFAVLQPSFGAIAVATRSGRGR
jgi:hypothetical protein